MPIVLKADGDIPSYLEESVELIAEDRKKVLGLIKNKQHELTVNSVINCKSPGNVYVDDTNNPKAFFIKTPECNMIGGSASSSSFNSAVKEHIGYFDSIVCDTEEWTEAIGGIHPNCALKKFLRKYFRHANRTEVRYPLDTGKIEFIFHKDLNAIQYVNKEIVHNWINILGTEDIKHIPLAAIVVKDSTIVTCSGLDCINGNSVEVGIKTAVSHRKNGYAAFAVSSLVNKLYEVGISNIGWHCMSSNIGSIKTAIKCGFEEELAYESFFPFPPIENDMDISAGEWYELGKYYEDKGNASAVQYWQAARCFAHSMNESSVIFCVGKLIEQNQIWFLKHIEECHEFGFMAKNKAWIQLVAEANRKNT